MFELILELVEFIFASPASSAFSFVFGGGIAVWATLRLQKSLISREEFHEYTTKVQSQHIKMQKKHSEDIAEQDKRIDEVLVLLKECATQMKDILVKVSNLEGISKGIDIGMNRKT